MAELLNLERVVGDGYHNAFTDLLRWRGHYYLAFRKSEHHGTRPPGKVVVLRSADLRTWGGMRLPEHGGRRPRSETGGCGRPARDRLRHLVPALARGQPAQPGGGSHLPLPACRATAWPGAARARIWGPNYWLWRVFASADEGFFCSAYHFAHRPNRTERSIHPDAERGSARLALPWPDARTGRTGRTSALPSPRPRRSTASSGARGPTTIPGWAPAAPPTGTGSGAIWGVMVHAPVVLQAHGQWLVAGAVPAGRSPAGHGAARQRRAHHALACAFGGPCRASADRAQRRRLLLLRLGPWHRAGTC